MKTEEVITYFKGCSNTALALGISQPAVSNWGWIPPLGRQYQIQEITQGELKVENTAKEGRQ